MHVQLSEICLAQEGALIGTIIVLALVVLFMAVWQRHQGDTADETTAQKVSLSLLRALCGLVAFAALVLLTNPALTCIFPDKTPGSTRIPDWMQSYILESVAIALSVVAAKVPNLVTDPKVV